MKTVLSVAISPSPRFFCLRTEITSSHLKTMTYEYFPDLWDLKNFSFPFVLVSMPTEGRIRPLNTPWPSRRARHGLKVRWAHGAIEALTRERYLMGEEPAGSALELHGKLWDAEICNLSGLQVTPSRKMAVSRTRQGLQACNLVPFSERVTPTRF